MFGRHWERDLATNDKLRADYKDVSAPRNSELSALRLEGKLTAHVEERRQTESLSESRLEIGALEQLVSTDAELRRRSRSHVRGSDLREEAHGPSSRLWTSSGLTCMRVRRMVFLFTQKSKRDW